LPVGLSVGEAVGEAAGAVGKADGFDTWEQPWASYQIASQIELDHAAARDGRLERCGTLVADTIALQQQPLQRRLSPFDGLADASGQLRSRLIGE
jgi:hypothetical protein